MAEKAKGDSSTAFTTFADIKKREKVARLTNEKRSAFTKSGQGGLPREMASDIHTSQSFFSASLKKDISEKQRCQRETTTLPLHNRYTLLSTNVTCDRLQSTLFSDLGQAQTSSKSGPSLRGDKEDLNTGLGDKEDLNTGLGGMAVIRNGIVRMGLRYFPL